MTTKRTFTQLLLREIRAHLEFMATDPARSGAEQAALYMASREVGRNTPKFVQEARRKLDWQEVLVSQEANADGS